MRYANEVITLRPAGVRVKQVNKTAARKAYNNGHTVYLNACNMRLNNPWTSPIPVHNEDNATSFDSIVNSFEYYNCVAECGKYANFFVEV